MARHNRRGGGEDQHGRRYLIDYHPDWLQQVKVSRQLESGRQSTRILLRNPDRPASDPGPRIRTRIAAPELGIDLEVSLRDERRVVRRITVETVVPEGDERGDVVSFVLSRVPGGR
jgi:hypothetical protein